MRCVTQVRVTGRAVILVTVAVLVAADAAPRLDGPTPPHRSGPPAAAPLGLAYLAASPAPAVEPQQRPPLGDPRRSWDPQLAVVARQPQPSLSRAAAVAAPRLRSSRAVLTARSRGPPPAIARLD
jgi:hypothetical protein